MSDLLRIGSQAVNVYRGALAVVGDNVANANTEGYTRRDVNLRESAIMVGGNPLYRETLTGGGVGIASVSRAWDSFLATDARNATSDAQHSAVQMRWLGVAEAALDTGDYGVGARLTAFFASADTLAADPDGDAPRRAMLSNLEGVTSALAESADALAEAAEGIASEAQTTVDALNGDLKALAEINRSLQRTAPGSMARAQLEDERDRLLDGLSGRISIDVTQNERGAVTVRANGSAGPTLVSGIDAAFVDMAQGADGRLSLSVTYKGETDALPAQGGSIAGLVDASRSTADRRHSLDAIASDFAASLNAWAAAGTDRNGNPGQPILSGTGASDLVVAISDPREIPAASGGVANGNLLNLSSLRGSEGAEARHASLVTSQAQQLASARSRDTALATRKETSLATRDGVSGVDLDREAAELLRYQQAYGASAKIIQVARETLQSILNLF